MSLVYKNLKMIQEETRQLRRKQIQKQKRKNQYTQEFRFGSDLNMGLLKDVVVPKLKIPKVLQCPVSIHLSTDLQIPISLPSENRLGSLSISPFCQNYYGVRIDQKAHLLILSLEPYDRPIIPFDTIYNIFKKQFPRVAVNLLQFQEIQERKHTDPYNLVSEAFLTKFEQDVIAGRPYLALLCRQKGGHRVTLQHIINLRHLDLMAINKEMFVDYVFDSKLIPNLLYSDPNDTQLELVDKMFQANIFKGQCEIEMSNYNGERFSMKSDVYQFTLYEEQEQAYYEYYYYIQNPDPKWVASPEKVGRNYLEYFNIKKQKRQEIQPKTQQRRCEWREIQK